MSRSSYCEAAESEYLQSAGRKPKFDMDDNLQSYEEEEVMSAFLRRVVVCLLDLGKVNQWSNSFSQP
jgi:hypothetical protein